MTAKKTTSTRRTPSRAGRRRLPGRRELLDRARLTVESPNHRAGRADWDEADPNGSSLKGDAPRNFRVTATFERGQPWLWVGVDAEPTNPDAGRTCFAVICGDALRSLAIDVLRCYPAKRTGGAR